MAKRRSLADGLKASAKADPKKEVAFVYGGDKTKNSASKKSTKPKPQPELSAPLIAPQDREDQQAEPTLGRTPLTTRLRSDIGAALKRASLERQLGGQTPHTVQDILESVLEPWLKSHGYLK